MGLDRRSLVTVTLDIGALRQTASLAVGTAVPDGNGGYTVAYAPLNPETWRCAIARVSVRMAERHFDATIIAKATHVLNGRFHAQLDTNCRVTWTDRAGTVHVAQVLDIDDTEGAGVETVIAVSEIL